MPSFGEQFLAGFTAAQVAQRTRQREQLEQQHLALERQRTMASIQAQEQQAKASEIERQQQDLLMQLKIGETQDQPTAAVSQEAGGMGPPAPTAGQTLTAPLHGGGTLSTPMRYRQDVQQQELETQQQQGQAKLGLEAQGRARTVGPKEAKVIGVTPGVYDKDVLDEVAATMRTRISASAAHAAVRGAMSLADPATQAAVESLADRVSRGEVSLDTARGLLGGVKGGLGPSLVKALGDRAVLPAGVRKDFQALQTTRNIVDQMESLVGDVVNAKTPEDRVQATLLLEQYGRTTGTLLSRGFGERGVVTDKDVSRATGLVPGWKAANFAPEYAAREIELLHDTLNRNERSITEGYFKTVGTTKLGAPTKKRRVYDPATDSFTEQ